MAQAARLNLRMQKEIKLLLDDPPHGVSLDENVLSSLSSIEARIEGPDETVYAKGVFILKIQIPDRCWYPFQPPNVTFVTPIYHPNIDNGGRICLDILNLPPKGAWQPSLNIATVLTSIGLLLSEPNPDDGLMAEISREYKYNRQVFDINARLWTEKYASPAPVGASSWGSVDAGVLAQNTQMEDTETLGSLPNASKKDNEGNQRKLRLLGQKLLLKSERSEESMKTVKQDPVASHLPMAGSTYPTGCFSDVSGRQNDMSKNMSVSTASGVISKKEYQGNINNLQLPGQRLSVTSEATSKRSDVNDTLPNHLPASASDANDHSMRSSDDILESSLARSIGGSSDISYKPPEGNRRKIRRLGLKLPLEPFKPEMKSDEQKENMAPNHLSSQPGFNNLQKRPFDAVKPEKKSDEQKENMASSHLPSQPGFNNLQKRPLDSEKPEKKSDEQKENMASSHLHSQPGFNNSQKRPLDAVKPANKSDEQKENMASNHLPSQPGFNNSQKRPLDAVKPANKSDEQKENMASNHLPSQPGFNNLQKRPLDAVKPEKKSDEQKENMASNHQPSKSGFNNLQKRPLDAVSRKKFSGGPALVQQNPITEHQLSNTKMVSNEECNQGRKKLCSLSRRLSLKTELFRVDTACDKEDKPPNCSLSDKKPNELLSSAAPAPVPKGEAVVPSKLPLVAPAVLKSQTPAIGFAGGQKDANTGNSSVKQNTVTMENVVVADSEESEDESERPQRSRLSQMRRRLAGKLRT